MRQEAANSLLKVLEEPPARSMIILTTSKLNALPQTISGRCQKIHFEQLSNQQVAEKLAATTEFSKNDIALASNIATGSYSRAPQLLEYGINDIRSQALQYMVSILKNEYADAVLAARNITAKNDRVKTRYFLYFLNTWFKDLLHVKFDDINDIANSDVVDRLRKLAANYPDTDIFGIVMEIEEADKLITQNISLTLILVNLAFRLKALIH
jgi:DNA polymerase-3 subunit delta'